MRGCSSLPQGNALLVHILITEVSVSASTIDGPGSPDA